MAESIETRVNEYLIAVRRYLADKTLAGVEAITRYQDLCREASDARAQLAPHGAGILDIDANSVRAAHRLIESIDAELARTVAELCRTLSGLLNHHLDSDKTVDKAKAEHATLVTKLGKTAGYFRPNQTVESCMRQAVHIAFLNRAPAVCAVYGQFDMAQQRYFDGRALARKLDELAAEAEAQFRTFATA